MLQLPLGVLTPRWDAMKADILSSSHSLNSSESVNSNQAEMEVKNMFYQLFGDKNRYMQLVLNFLSNSIHYTKKGGKISINLVLLEEQVIKPPKMNATHTDID